MAEIKHTPGPWARAGHRQIAQVSGTDLPMTICEVWSGGVGIEQADANERLIAASPDLFEAARAAEAILSRGRWIMGSTDPEAVALWKLRAALAKTMEVSNG